MYQVYRVDVCRFHDPGSVYSQRGIWVYYMTEMVWLHAAYFSQEEQTIMKENYKLQAALLLQISMNFNHIFPLNACF